MDKYVIGQYYISSRHVWKNLPYNRRKENFNHMFEIYAHIFKEIFIKMKENILQAHKIWKTM